MEILGALFSVFTIWLVTGVIVNEAISRISHPEDVAVSAATCPAPSPLAPFSAVLRAHELAALMALLR